MILNEYLQRKPVNSICCQLVLIISTITASHGQQLNMVPEAVLNKVYFIKVGETVGSCFIVSIDSNDYLITAKHLFGTSAAKTVDFEINHKNMWIKQSATFLPHKNPLVDVAALDLKRNDLKNNVIDLGGEAHFLSQECWFLGFPFGLKMDDNSTNEMNRGFPLPFVKKGIISSTAKNDSVNVIFIDGHNNPGFSGGPVVVENLELGPKHNFVIIGIVSSYLSEKKVIKTPIGDLVNTENSGIVVAYDFNNVFQLIKSYR